jgi:predicted AAA+ superfamily ATPase
MIPREIAKKIKATSKSILLLGPRQTGKSTLLSGLTPDLTINLARENEFLRYSSQIDLFSDQIESSDAKIIFVDEIQRIPSLLNTIQAIIDESKNKRSLRFFLSGSSARKLRRGHANLLPGRVFTFQIAGLCAKEVGYEMNYLRVMKYGTLPEPFFEKNDDDCEKLLESYASSYLKEEIQAEALARDIQGFSRFLITLAAVSGQVLDFSKISTRAKVSRSSCIRFVEILEDTLIAQRVPVFEGAETADVIRHSKLYFFDVGVLNGLLNNFTASDDRKGLLFEHLIYSQIRNSALALDLPIEIQFFRTRHGVEVDFIVKLRGKIWAIEVKAGDVDSQDLKGLETFREYFPDVHRCVVVSPKEKARNKNDIFICDWMTLLKEMDL